MQQAASAGFINPGGASLTMPRMVDPEDMSSVSPSNPQLYPPIDNSTSAPPLFSHRPTQLSHNETEMGKTKYSADLTLFGTEVEDERMVDETSPVPVRCSDSVEDIDHEDSFDTDWSNGGRARKKKRGSVKRTTVPEPHDLGKRKIDYKEASESDWSNDEKVKRKKLNNHTPPSIRSRKGKIETDPNATTTQSSDSDQSSPTVRATRRSASKATTRRDQHTEHPLSRLRSAQRKSQGHKEKVSTNGRNSSRTPVPSGNAGEASEPGSRSLRNRTLQQTHPFKFEQVQNQLNKSGKVAQTDEIEEMVKEKIGSKKQNRSKRMKTTNGDNIKKPMRTINKTQDNARRSGSITSVLSSSRGSGLERIKLQIWLDGFDAGAAPAALDKFQNVDELVDFMVDAWEWRFNG